MIIRHSSHWMRIRRYAALILSAVVMLALPACSEDMPEPEEPEKEEWDGNEDLDKMDCEDRLPEGYEPTDWDAINNWLAGQGSKSSDGKKIINLAFHMIIMNGTTGYGKEAEAASLVEAANRFFSDTNIEFRLKSSEYMNKMTTAWAQTLDFSDDNLKRLSMDGMFPYAINVFVLGDYSTVEEPGISWHKKNAVFLNKESARNYTTLAHELGHCFDLYHTHYGTSGEGVENGALTEFVNGFESNIRGDFMTDTPADPNIWNANGYAGGDLTDAHGDKYNPDPYNMMSYSNHRRRFSPKQIATMHYNLETDDVLKGTVVGVYDIVGEKHFNSSQQFSINSITFVDRVEWTVKRHTGSTSDDGAITISTEKYSGQNITLNSSKSEYFEIVASIYQNNKLMATIPSWKATSNEPSPYTGTLAWSTNNGQSGGTTNQNWGSTLSIGSDLNLRLDYIDKAQASLPGLTFMCVTAANRLLRGSMMNITKSDCSSGYLKIRAIDNCGTSANFFTIQTNVVGAYYAVGVEADEISFTGAVGTSAGGPNKAPGKAPVISHVDIYTLDGKAVYSADYDSAKSISIPRSELGTGSYKAIISDGNSTEEVLFDL